MRSFSQASGRPAPAIFEGAAVARGKIGEVSMLRFLLPALLVLSAGCVAQEKPAIDEMQAARGRALFVERCGFCHGNDARGNRAPDLVRSPVVMRDEKGEMIGPVIRNGRPDKGMPAFPLPDADIAAISVFLHEQLQAA